jgi:hypothetical protein
VAIHDRSPRLHRLFQGALYLTDGGAEDLAARLTDRLVTGDAGDLFCGVIKRSDPESVVDGEDSVGDRVQDDGYLFR